MRSGRVWVVCAGLVAVLFCLIVVAVLREFAGETRRAGDAASDEPTPRPVKGMLVVRAETEVVRRVHYRPCAETLERSASPPADMLGASLPWLQRFYPQWTVLEFGSERVVLYRETDEMCDELLFWRLVRLDGDGVVRIYYGRKGREGQPIKEETAITADMLMPRERGRLLEGLEFPGDEAVRSYLEIGHSGSR